MFCNQSKAPLENYIRTKIGFDLRIRNFYGLNTFIRKIKSNEGIIYSFVIMITVKQLDTGRHNNFDLLRFIAATLVMFSHSYLVTGNFQREPLVRLTGDFLDLGKLGVRIFFTISGYLITKSMFRQSSLSSFVWARFLRIFPGLLATSLFCAFVIGPICTTLPAHEYFASGKPYNFVWLLTTLHVFNNYLPGVFLSNPFPNLVNSPIWTLQAELMMYILVLVIGVLLLIWKRQFKKIFISVPVLLAVFILCKGFMPLPQWYEGHFYSWAILFLLGMCSYLLRSKILLNIPLFVIMVLVLGALFHFQSLFKEYFLDVTLVYGILIFVYHPQLQVNSFHKLGDFSYGLYIYAFPIQQMLILKLPELKPLLHFTLSFPLALTLAIFSWYFIESPALKLKHLKLKFPGYKL